MMSTKSFVVNIEGNKRQLSLEEFAWDNIGAYEYYEKRPNRYYTLGANGEQIVKEKNLLEWVKNEIELSKFILKEDFVEELANEGIDVFTYEQDLHLTLLSFDDYTPLPDQVKFICILKAYWKFKDINFYYTNDEIKEAFGIDNVEELLEEMVKMDWISVDVVTNHPEIRCIYEAW